MWRESEKFLLDDKRFDDNEIQYISKVFKGANDFKNKSTYNEFTRNIQMFITLRNTLVNHNSKSGMVQSEYTH